MGFHRQSPLPTFAHALPEISRVTLAPLAAPIAGSGQEFPGVFVIIMKEAM